jgi:tetratricopeptide (TPR) repeat protein
MALTMIAPLPEARQALEDVMRLLPVSDDTWWTANALGNIGRTYQDEGHLDAARVYMERSRRVSEEWHDRAELAWIQSNIGECTYLAGDWSEARDWYRRAIRLAREVRAARYLSYALLHLAELCSAEGRWQEAGSLIAEGMALAETSTAVPASRKAQRLLAEHDLLEGQPHLVPERLRPWHDLPYHDEPRCFPPPVLAEAYLEMGRVAAADELVRRRVNRFQAHNHRRALALWLRVQGLTQARQQQRHDARAAFEEAIAIARAMPYPYAEAQTLAEWGRLLVSWGDTAAGHAHLERALAISERLGARPLAERIQRDLEREPAIPPPSAEPG